MFGIFNSLTLANAKGRTLLSKRVIDAAETDVCKPGDRASVLCVSVRRRKRNETRIKIGNFILKLFSFLCYFSAVYFFEEEVYISGFIRDKSGF
jgi:hypothetical protein